MATSYLLGCPGPVPTSIKHTSKTRPSEAAVIPFCWHDTFLVPCVVALQRFVGNVAGCRRIFWSVESVVPWWARDYPAFLIDGLCFIVRRTLLVGAAMYSGGLVF